MENIFNTTLDISNVDETMIEDLNLNDYGSLDVEIKEPHLKLSTKEFLEALKIAKSTISSNSKDLISRSALLKVEGGVLYLYCTDFESKAEIERIIAEYNKDKVEEKTNIYKWENKDNNIFHNIVITIDKNDAENKYNVKHFNNEDIANYTKYIEESTNNELKEYDIKVKVSNMKKEVINKSDARSYDTLWPTIDKLGYNTYQKGFIYTTNNYIITLTYTSNQEIKNDDETFTSIKNSFQIKDESIKQESFLDSKTNRIILTAVILGLIGVIISLIIQKKHN